MEIIFKRTHGRVKKPEHIDGNVFAIYAAKAINIEPATSYSIDTKLIVLLPDNLYGYVTSKFRRDEIHKFSAKKQRMWVEILNKSYEFKIEIKKNSVLGFVIEPEHLPYKHTTEKEKKKDKIPNKPVKQQVENANDNTAVS